MDRDFHDIDFDGVVIKIPRWIIEIKDNERLRKTLEELKKCFKDDKLIGKNHPSIGRNIYEIENVHKKKERLNRLEKRQDLQRKIYDGILDFVLEYKLFLSILEKDEYHFSIEKFVLNGKEFDVNKMASARGNKTKWFKEFIEEVKKLNNEKLAEFIQGLGYISEFTIKGFLQGWIKFDTFYINKFWALSIRFKTPVFCHFVNRNKYRMVFPKYDKETERIYYELDKEKVFINELEEVKLPGHWIVVNPYKVFKRKGKDENIEELINMYKKYVNMFEKEV